MVEKINLHLFVMVCIGDLVASTFPHRPLLIALTARLLYHPSGVHLVYELLTAILEPNLYSLAHALSQVLLLSLSNSQSK